MCETQHNHGQALVEFALLVTLVITLLLGIFDFGRAYYTQVQIKNAVGDAGYYAIHHPDDESGIKNTVRQQLTDLQPALTNSDITITLPDCSAGNDKTRIKVRYQYSLLFTWLIPSATVTLGDETYVPKLTGCP